MNIIRGPTHRFDIVIMKKTNVPSHGILAQSFNFEKKYNLREYDRFDYKELSIFTQRNKTIEQKLTDYQVSGPFDTNTKLSLYDQPFHGRQFAPGMGERAELTKPDFL